MCMFMHARMCELLPVSTGCGAGEATASVGPAKRSNHKHLNVQMALMSCVKQPVLTDEPVNPA